MKVFVDTNVLLGVLDSKTDVAALLKEEFLDVELLVLRQSLEEVEAVRPTAFDSISDYVKKRAFAVIEGSGKADDLLVNEAKKERAAVATLDFALKKRLKRAGIQIISLKNGKLVL